MVATCLYVERTDVADAGDIRRGHVERMSTVTALEDAVRKQVDFVLAEDEEVDESVVLGNVDSYNVQELVEENRLHHRQLRVAYKRQARRITSLLVLYIVRLSPVSVTCVLSFYCDE